MKERQESEVEVEVEVETGNGAGASRPRLPSMAMLVTIIGITVLLYFVVRHVSPSELLDKDQERPAAYMMDVLVNGNWIIQRDTLGDVASKPSLYTWLAAGISILVGRANEFTLYLPTALSVFGTALILLIAGDRYYSRRVGFTAAAMFLLSMVAWKQVQLARTDPLFSFLTVAGLFVLFAVIRGRASWVLFWFIAALITLTKGPLGVILALGGLFALLWERKSLAEHRLAPPKWNEQLLGIALFVLITGGWFLLAWLQMRQALIDKMITDELVGHAVAGERGKRPGEGFFFPLAYYITRFAPWALLGLAGIARVLIKPDPDPRRRLLDRFLVSHFLLGLLIFSLSVHQRPDHLFPLIPASILLGARELERWWKAPLDRRGLAMYSGALFLFLAVQIVYTQTHKANHLKTLRMAEIDRFAERIRSEVGRDFPLIHVDADYAVQFRLGTMTQQVPMEWGVEALLSDHAAYLVINKPTVFLELIPEDFEPHWLDQRTAREEPFLWLVSNREGLQWHDRMVRFADGVRLESEGLRYTLSPETAPRYRRMRDGASLRLTNMTEERRDLTIVVDRDGSTEKHPVTLYAEQSVHYFF